MLYPDLQTVLDHKCLLGEGPVWDNRRHRLLWVDILQGVVHQFFPITGEHIIFNTGEMIGAIALCEGGGFIAAMKSGFALIDDDGRSIQPIIDPEAHLPDNRFNDGKCDPAGNFWAGTMSLKDEPRTGGLYTLFPDGKVEWKLGNISISNGLAWSIDQHTFYHIDTPTFRVVAYDYSLATADLSNSRTVIEVPKHFGDPDGMTIDSEGMLWIAHWDGWQITRWNPLTGELLLQINLPVARVTSCTFGGETLEDLYITSASTGLSEEQLIAQPLAGSLFVIRSCGYKGTLPFRFMG